VRTELDISTPAECLKVLESEFAGLTIGQVKKACSKASKRTGGLPQANKVESDPAAAAKPSKRQEKEAAKAAAHEAAELKSAEALMMECHRKLRAVKEGTLAGAVTIQGTMEEFIQRVSQRAIAGILEHDEQAHLKQRIEADICTLEWVKLAQKAGALSLKEDVMSLGVEVQLARLKEVRGGKDVTAAMQCYAVEDKPQRSAPTADATAALDARVKAAAAAQHTGEAFDEMD
jgi:hypothetical protein